MYNLFIKITKTVQYKTALIQGLILVDILFAAFLYKTKWLSNYSVSSFLHTLIIPLLRNDADLFSLLI